MINSRTTSPIISPNVVHRAMLSGVLASLLYFGAASSGHAQSGDGPVAGAIVDELNELYGDIADVIVTTACLEGNPFVPDDPPVDGPTLSGCKLDIPAGSTLSLDNHQLITVLPNNFKDGDTLTTVNTFSSGSNTALESDTTVRAVSKDLFLGLANPELFGSPPATSAVATTADVFCTSIGGGFDCAKIEPCSSSGCPSNGSGPCPKGLIIDADDSDGFCSDLSGLLEGSYNLATNPLAYAISTNMSILAQPNSVTLRLCAGFQAQCLPLPVPPLASNVPIASNVRVTSMHTQNAAVDTPRLRLPYY